MMVHSLFEFILHLQKIIIVKLKKTKIKVKQMIFFLTKQNWIISMSQKKVNITFYMQVKDT